MSAKPLVSLARWADQIGANLVSPTSGERDLGFGSGTPASAGKFNYEINQLYQWALWLSDGDCAFHNLSATGTLGVTGPSTLTGALAANGGIAVPTGQAVTLSGTTTLSVGGNATVGGSLGVTGATTLTGALAANGGVLTTTLTTSGTATVGGQTLTFTSFTFTANSGTDQLTATGHPMQTGDGPVQVSDSGGTLAAPLAAATNYWAIRIDANTIQLATSFANAIAGIAIDLTTNGTGTQTLATTGSTVRPTDATVTRSLTVNGNLTVLGGLVLPPEQHTAGDATFAAASGYSFVAANGTTGSFIDLGTGTQAITCPLVLNVGRIVTQWNVWFKKTTGSAASLSATLWDKNLFTNARTSLSTAGSAANNPGNMSIGQTGLWQILFGHVFEIDVIGSGTTGDRLHGWSAG